MQISSPLSQQDCHFASSSTGIRSVELVHVNDCVLQIQISGPAEGTVHLAVTQNLSEKIPPNLVQMAE